MKILVADDDRLTRRMLEMILTEWGYEIVLAADGNQAWDVLQGKGAPKLALLDWLMPGMNGPEVCQHLRAIPTREPTYVIMLTVKDGRKDIVTGLRGGADDYVIKPFDNDELQARLNTGVRVVELQRHLASQIRALEESLERVKQLQGLLPICAYCKSIRDGHDYWQAVETYLSSHADVCFSHGICPNCYTTQVEPQLRELRSQGSGVRGQESGTHETDF
jgi:sigma-B regulation protein RsbU (phosphoserine phosphatase)